MIETHINPSQALSDKEQQITPELLERILKLIVIRDTSESSEYLADLRDVLLTKRSKVEDIFGLGLNLITGEIDYVGFMNRRNPQLAKNGEIAAAQKERIETLIRYFFGDLAPFKAERERPRYTRQPFQAIA